MIVVGGVVLTEQANSTKGLEDRDRKQKCSTGLDDATGIDDVFIMPT